MLSAALLCAGGVLLTGCSAHGETESDNGAPPSPKVEHESNGSVVSVSHPERFALAAVAMHKAPSVLSVTGAVNPDVSRAVPVISLASGRVVEIHARLGDQVHKGQLLLRVQSTDVAGAWSDYQHAQADETLARAQFERANDLFKIGAIARKDLEVAQDAHDKAAVDVRTTRERLRVLGVNADQPPNSLVDILAPISGVITEQQVTNAAGVQSLGTNPFTISDLSFVWVVCDVYEQDLPNLHVGDSAEIHLTAYPNEILTGSINNILPILDPNIRTAKVRIEVRNPGTLRLGMFVTAIFRSQRLEQRASVPSTAVLHLHDRDFVYVPGQTSGQFRRVEVVAGGMLAGNQQEIVSGVDAGDRVVVNALVLQNTAEQ
jgi:cobalt-zinc-cadmium efflux system membrane fusion protein